MKAMMMVPFEVLQYTGENADEVKAFCEDAETNRRGDLVIMVSTASNEDGWEYIPVRPGEWIVKQECVLVDWKVQVLPDDVFRRLFSVERG